MPIVERDLTSFELPPKASKSGASVTSFTLVSSSSAVFKGFTFELSFPLPNAYRVLLTGPDRPPPPQDNVILNSEPVKFTVTSLDTKKATALIGFPKQAGSEFDGTKGKKREIHLDWTDSIVLTVYETDGSGKPARLLGDIPSRSYALTEHGITRHWWIERNNIHLGLGEKSGPINLSGRSFQIHGSDSAAYDAFEGDPLYKHTPFLLSVPKPENGRPLPSTYAIYHPTNSNSIWDIGRAHDDPWGYFKTFIQDYGGLEEWVLVGKGVKECVRTFAETVGKPKLVGRDWLGYLASGMGLGESDNPPAQELLSTWPDLCKQYDIPCSAMHLSSGYTTGEKDGNRYVFTMNKKRYPDFKGMVGLFHKAGIKVVPNIKPFMLETHPDYADLHEKDAHFHDPWTGKPAQTRLWSSGVGTKAPGSWVDFTSEAGREWWSKGVKGLVDLGVDGMWNDNNEFYIHDDAFLSKNQFSPTLRSNVNKPETVGLMGRMINTEMMAKVSNDTVASCNPERRTYVLTRSGNVGTFKYACSTWSGDNETSWKTLRGSQPIQLNSSLSLMQSYGSDVGGFAGPLPSPELFTRWVQLGVTHSRFCIHSYKPNKNDPSGAADTNTPWMYPEVLPIIRATIKWRYEYLPFFNSLMWDSHINANPTNAWLGWGEFSSDPELFTQSILDGYDAWIGAGQLLSAPALFESMTSRGVYFPKSSPEDKSVYFDLYAPYGRHIAGTKVNISTPLEHMGLFAREGSVIPIGKSQNTVTQIEGPARTTTDNVDIVLDSEGGVVGLDDWRGVRIFPIGSGTYTGQWIEDDGISMNPRKSVISVKYTASEKEVDVKVKFVESGFQPLWGKVVHIILPVGDARTVKGAKEVSYKDRTAWGVVAA